MKQRAFVLEINNMGEEVAFEKYLISVRLLSTDWDAR